ncbi:MAG: transposase zinc-binding domain-containing protein [Candidatus Rokubacteria bacterium]|nr:transposase zinc-binding domain-containing protein [Candidatus Rokubacteria bacterium]
MSWAHVCPSARAKELSIIIGILAYHGRQERGVAHMRRAVQDFVRQHLETFLAEAARAAGGAHLPAFVEHEFRDFLTCGVLAHGFARVRCDTCAFERLVPFSCKGCGFCPSCGGRRMTERATHLVTEVLPRVPLRQWVPRTCAASRGPRPTATAGRRAYAGATQAGVGRRHESSDPAQPPSTSASNLFADTLALAPGRRFARLSALTRGATRCYGFDGVRGVGRGPAGRQTALHAT